VKAGQPRRAHKEEEGEEGDAQLLVLAAEMDKAGIDKVKKSVEQVEEKIDEVKGSVKEDRRAVE